MARLSRTNNALIAERVLVHVPPRPSRLIENGPSVTSKDSGTFNELSPGLRRILERKKLFLGFGYDFDYERDTILDQASPLRGRILEAGTGKGHFAVALARRGVSFTSFDISKEEMELARLFLKHLGLDHFVDLRIESGDRLSFEDGYFDMVFSVNALHHFKDAFRSVDELARVLAPSGKLVLSDFTEKGFETLDRIHALDGSIHDRGSVGMPAVEDYLKSRYFRIRKTGTMFHQTLIAEKSP